MVGLLKRLRPPPLVLWIALCVLFTFGILSTVIDLTSLGTAETRRANETQQRAIIDPQSGNVSLGDSASNTSFDVGSTEEKPAPNAEASPAETTPAMPVDEHATAPAAPAAKPELKGLPTLRTEPLKTSLPEITYSKASLISAPAPEVSEKNGDDVLPKRGLNDATPAATYAQRFTHHPKEQLLSIVIINAGFSAQTDGLIFGLPNTVTVGFSPYGRDTTHAIEMLRRAGFEAWGMLPAMGEHFPQDDPGPLGLVTSLPKDELMRRLRNVMSSTIGAVGLILPPDETITAKPAVFAPLLSEINTRGLELLSTNPGGNLKDITKDEKLAAILQRADLIVDAVPDEGQIQSKLASIPAALKKKGSLIVVISARPQSLVLLQHWLKDTPIETLAPLSAQWAPKVVAPKEEKKEGHGSEKKEESAAEKKDGAEEKPEPEHKAEEPEHKAEKK